MMASGLCIKWPRVKPSKSIIMTMPVMNMVSSSILITSDIMKLLFSMLTALWSSGSNANGRKRITLRHIWSYSNNGRKVLAEEPISLLDEFVRVECVYPALSAACNSGLKGFHPLKNSGRAVLMDRYVSILRLIFSKRYLQPRVKNRMKASSVSKQCDKSKWIKVELKKKKIHLWGRCWSGAAVRSNAGWFELFHCDVSHFHRCNDVLSRRFPRW